MPDRIGRAKALSTSRVEHWGVTFLDGTKRVNVWLQSVGPAGEIQARALLGAAPGKLTIISRIDTTLYGPTEMSRRRD